MRQNLVSSQGRIVGAAVFGVLLAASPVWANAGYPMIFVVWPAAWVLLVPVILVEMWVARRLLGLNLEGIVALTTAANLGSALLGIPIAWFGLALVETQIFHGPGLPSDPHWKIKSITIWSPWLWPPDEAGRNLAWMVPAAGAALCVPFYFVSVGCEGVIARWIVGRKRSREAWRWAWWANLASYGPILVGLVLWSLRAAWKVADTV